MQILPQVRSQSIVADYAHCLSGCYIRPGLGDSMELTVTDDGIGFDISVEHRGAGLKNISARADYVRGKLNITSNHSGTVIPYSYR